MNKYGWGIFGKCLIAAFSIMTLSMGAQATEPSIQNCLNELPETISLIEANDSFSFDLSKQQVSDFEKEAPGMGYGVFYQGQVRMGATSEALGLGCRISQFVYTGEMNPKSEVQPFSKEAQMEHLLLSTDAMSQMPGRTFAQLDKASLNIPESGQLMAFYGQMDVMEKPFLLSTAFYTNETERIIIGCDGSHYLKTLITCDSWEDVEMDKRFMSLVSHTFMEKIIPLLKKCENTKG